MRVTTKHTQAAHEFVIVPQNNPWNARVFLQSGVKFRLAVIIFSGAIHLNMIDDTPV